MTPEEQPRAAASDDVWKRLSMEGRHALVTGAGSGLGFSIAEGLLRAGAGVTLVDIDAEALQQRREELAELSVRAELCVADVSEPERIEDAVRDAAAAHGRLDSVFANAGIAGEAGICLPEGRLYEVDWGQWQRTVQINLTGALATVKAGAEAIRAAGEGGSIVFTVSTAGLRADALVSYGYAASKGALLNIVRQAAVDLAPDGIRVNGIAPGPFKTRIGGPGPVPEEIDRMWSSTVPLDRMGDAEELQGLAVLLASDASSYITGTTISIDGGVTAGNFSTVFPERTVG